MSFDVKKKTTCRSLTQVCSQLIMILAMGAWAHRNSLQCILYRNLHVIANIVPTVCPMASRSHGSILLRKFIHVAIFKKSIEIWFSCKRSQMIKSSKSQSGYQKIWSHTNWFCNFLKLWKLLLISYIHFFVLKEVSLLN